MALIASSSHTSSAMQNRQHANNRYLAVWNGEVELSELDGLLTPDYIGHVGSRNRDLAELKDDIAAYRIAAPGVRFTLEHQFGESDHLVSRITAAGTDAAGRRVSARGMNVGRWEDARLAEEWAVWEPLR